MNSKIDIARSTCSDIANSAKNKCLSAISTMNDICRQLVSNLWGAKLYLMLQFCSVFTCWPFTDNFRSVTDHFWSITDHFWPLTDHLRPLTDHLRPLTDHLWPVTNHLWLLSEILICNVDPIQKFHLKTFCLKLIRWHPYISVCLFV